MSVNTKKIKITILPVNIQLQFQPIMRLTLTFLDFVITSLQRRNQKFSTEGASICSIPPYPSLLSCRTKSALYSQETSWYESPAWTTARHWALDSV